MNSHVNPFDFQQTQQQVVPFAKDPFFVELVAPSALRNAEAGNIDFAYPWISSRAGPVIGMTDLDTGTTAATLTPDELGLGSPGTLSVLSPGVAFRDYVSLSGTPEDDISGSESVAFDATTGERPDGGTSTRHKCAKKSPNCNNDNNNQPCPIMGSDPTQQQNQQKHYSGSGSNPQTPKSRLRSASRMSKNRQHRPAETAEERKNRNSHNRVEKRYRQRLNVQFESLLNLLPDNLRSSPSGSGVEEAGTRRAPTGAGIDLGKKTVSKAEVLDMARQHIKMLERERDKLERERDGLLSTVGKLRKMYENGLEDNVELGLDIGRDGNVTC